MRSPGQTLAYVAIVLVVAASVGGLAAASAGSSPEAASSACSFNPAGLVIPAVANSTLLRIAETSPLFVSLTQGRSVKYIGSAASLRCSTLESIDANFAVTNKQGGGEDVIVSLAVGPGNVPSGVVIGVQVRPLTSFG